MKVGSGRSARRTGESNSLSSTHPLPLFHQEPRIVSVNGRESGIMADHHHSPVTSNPRIGVNHLACGHAIHWSSTRSAQIDAFVKIASPAPVARGQSPLLQRQDPSGRFLLGRKGPASDLLVLLSMGSITRAISIGMDRGTAQPGRKKERNLKQHPPEAFQVIPPSPSSL
jgi:hypothetical protein